jgi:hypothetical protein
MILYCIIFAPHKRRQTNIRLTREARVVTCKTLTLVSNSLFASSGADER